MLRARGHYGHWKLRSVCLSVLLRTPLRVTTVSSSFRPFLHYANYHFADEYLLEVQARSDLDASRSVKYCEIITFVIKRYLRSAAAGHLIMNEGSRTQIRDPIVILHRRGSHFNNSEYYGCRFRASLLHYSR